MSKNCPKATEREPSTKNRLPLCICESCKFGREKKCEEIKKLYTYPSKCRQQPCVCGKSKNFDLAKMSKKCEVGKRQKSGQEKGNGNRSFADFITETISIIAFFMIATVAFWIAILRNLILAGRKIYYASRNVKYFTLAVTVCILLSLTVSIVRSNYKATKAKAPPTSSTPTTPYLIQSKSGKHIELVAKDPKQMESLMSKENAPKVTKNITITITDSEAREIFKQSKLFAIPTEMKHPPTLLIYLRDVILNRY